MLERLRAKRFSALELIGFGSTAAWVVAAAAWAVTIPNTFSPGQVARSGEVNANFDALKTAVDALEAKLQYMTVVEGALVGLAGPHVIFEGANVHIRSGAGSTDEDQCVDDGCSGLGNLIIGYNEDFASNTLRTGAHNLVVGDEHGYTSTGGVVAGYQNDVTGRWASVLGGYQNDAGGQFATVSGGQGNDADGYASTVAGGGNNDATGQAAAVLGGSSNVASGFRAAIAGGFDNEAGDPADPDNGMLTGTALYTAVGGGYRNLASGPRSSVSGGQRGTASGEASSVSGGSYNVASGDYASVSGGGSTNVAFGNTASGTYASVSGGADNVADTTGGAIGGDSGLDTSASYQFLP